MLEFGLLADPAQLGLELLLARLFMSKAQTGLENRIHLGYVHEGLFAGHLAKVMLLELSLGHLASFTCSTARVAVVDA